MPRPDRKMEKINCFFPQGHIRSLIKIAVREGKTKSQIHREALSDYLENYRKKLLAEKSDASSASAS